MRTRPYFVVALALLIGAAMNILVAWALAAWGRGGVDTMTFNGPGAITTPAGGPPTVRYTGITIEARGVGWSSVAMDSQSRPLGGPYTLDIRWRAGWPFHAVGARHRATSPWPSMTAPGFPRVPAGLVRGLPAGPGSERRLPLVPLWPGFLVNTAVFSLVPLGVVAVLPWRRRRRRRLKGCCAACGYPIGASPVCTECGAAVAPPPTTPGTSTAQPSRCAAPPSS